MESPSDRVMNCCRKLIEQQHDVSFRWKDKVLVVSTEYGREIGRVFCSSYVITWQEIDNALFDIVEHIHRAVMDRLHAVE